MTNEESGPPRPATVEAVTATPASGADATVRPGLDEKITLRKAADLSVHPYNLEIYGEPDGGLQESLSQFGLQHPIVIDPQGRILSGARRWKATRLLGWAEVQTMTLEPESDAAAKKYILVANAYRAGKPDYMRKLEADAYLELLRNGEATKADLREMIARTGTVTEGYNLEAPTALAAAVAGMSRMTYSRYRYVLDHGADRAIDKAVRSNEVDPERGDSLRKLAGELATKLKRGKVGAHTADRRIRSALAEARRQHTLTERDRDRERAKRSFERAMSRGRAFLSSVHDLEPEVPHLGQAQAKALAGTITELGHVAAELGRRPHRVAGGAWVQLPPVSVPPHLYDRLQRLATLRKCSLSTLLAQVLEDDVSLYEMSTRMPPRASPLMGYDPAPAKPGSEKPVGRRSRSSPLGRSG